MDLEEAKNVIKGMDKFFLVSRAERLQKAKEFFNSIVGMSEPVGEMLYEGYECYLYLHNSASVAMTSAALELALKMKLSEMDIKYIDFKFCKLIDVAKDKQLFSTEDAEIANKIRDYRNAYVHGDIQEIRNWSEMIQVEIQNPEGIDLDEREVKNVKEALQLMEIKPEHAHFCLVNSYLLIRRLYPLPNGD